MHPFPDGFLWGAASAPHQVEGNNLNSDFWAHEPLMTGADRSGDALDSYHRYREDIRLVAESGLNTYRFGIEWARIEPLPGRISKAALAHYRRMIEACFAAGVTPFVTIHHFTSPRWFAEEGGWRSERAIDRFRSYVEATTPILDGVEWICTINEPNMLAIMVREAEAALDPESGQEWLSPTLEADKPRPVKPAPPVEIGRRLSEAHHAARDVLRARTEAKIGWTIANRAFETRPGAEEIRRELEYIWEDLYLEAARGDDYVGVQAYSAQWVGLDGIEPHPVRPDNTLVRTAYRPDALGIAVRHTAEVLPDVPIVITENGIATDDDARRIAYTTTALESLAVAMRDGIDVRGYIHWSLLDNYEWGHWDPTFGLVAVDRETFDRQPKPSLGWLGSVASANAI
ncbi:glycoside hydrolase family 1 protein [Microbacterium trichothecenolyticum]|uniref:family 1 glycosylhydrolase n=1 Tax=Microbacterium trichothecenolyticum TaxID=69370 RepID=UPI001C6EE973|nr:family 1 glycosylhydrolase [Microbacterium trichothecenolyticum]MBW9120474.1 glycoside hydrolase family 1 protein [Microbacterium trichothecenolyticum]